MKEKLTRQKFDDWLEKNDFEIETEVRSVCKKYRIDYIIKHISTDAIFGIEVKQDFDRLRGVDVANHILQAKNYSEAYFKTIFRENPVKVLIFLAPAPSNRFREIDTEVQKRQFYVNNWKGTKGFTKINFYPLQHDFHNYDCNISSFISKAFNVGELKKIHHLDNNIEVIFQFMNKTIWSNIHGLHFNNYKTYSPS